MLHTHVYIYMYTYTYIPCIPMSYRLATFIIPHHSWAFPGFLLAQQAGVLLGIIDSAGSSGRPCNAMGFPAGKVSPNNKLIST